MGHGQVFKTLESRENYFPTKPQTQSWIKHSKYCKKKNKSLKQLSVGHSVRWKQEIF